MVPRILLPLLLLLLIACNPSPKKPAASEPETWIQLFNGKDLDDWIIKINKHPLGENFNNTFRVRDGMMVTSYDAYETFDGEFGHIFYKTPFSHYKLRVEYRIVGEQVPGGAGWAYRNSGVMFHARPPEEMLVDQEFPVSLEAQFLGGSGEGERPTGNLCTPGTHVVIGGELVTRHCTNSTSATYHGEEWVRFELVVYGDSLIHHIVEGDTVLTYSKPRIGGELPEGFPLPEGTPVTSGYIALQAESHPFEFRKVELLDLSR
ncbi:MAG TPA: DUF1080 domain-containing protein [Bacteroides sp.]|nr:DUF1080 domain-containing protein [Bacteroides sp.]